MTRSCQRAPWTSSDLDVDHLDSAPDLLARWRLASTLSSTPTPQELNSLRMHGRIAPRTTALAYAVLRNITRLLLTNAAAVNRPSIALRTMRTCRRSIALAHLVVYHSPNAFVQDSASQTVHFVDR